MLFIRTIFQVYLAALSMIISVSYCLELADAFPISSSEEIGQVFSIFVKYLIPSILFLIFSSKWIEKIFLGVLICYVIALLGFNIIGLLPKKILFFGGFIIYIIIGTFIFYIIIFFPLLILVATTTQLISKLIRE